jgi:hypothetical protein
MYKLKAMKTHWGRGNIAPHIRNLHDWYKVIFFTLRSIYMFANTVYEAVEPL